MSTKSRPKASPSESSSATAESIAAAPSSSTTAVEQPAPLAADEETTMRDQKPAEGARSDEEPGSAPEPSPTTEEPGDQQDGAEEEPSELAKVRKEAAGHRTKLRDAEVERDGLLVQRDALAAAVVGDALQGTGITAEAFTAAGHDVEEFISADGGLDSAALRAAARDTARRFGIRSGRSPKTGTGSERPSEGKTWADALKG